MRGGFQPVHGTGILFATLCFWPKLLPLKPDNILIRFCTLCDKSQQKKAPFLPTQLFKNPKSPSGFSQSLHFQPPPSNMNHLPRKNCLFHFLRLKPFNTSTLYSNPNLCHRHCLQQWRCIVKVRLKWVKNRSIDHIIEKETDLKAASLLKDAIKRSSTGFLTAKSVADWQKLLGLTVPVLRFMRRYPTLFEEFPHPRWPSLPCFRLTDTALLLHSQEQTIHESHERDIVGRLCKVLMMMKTRTVPLNSLHLLKWDLGLPDCFEKTLVPKYPDLFQFAKASNGVASLRLGQWCEEFAVSALQKSNEKREDGNEYRDFKRGQAALVFPMRFPRGYGAQKKVRAWMEEFHKLPYISPYEDSRKIDPNSDLMEKRVVGVLHEFLSLTMHKKTKRNYLRSLRDDLNLPHKFTRIFTRYPGIFYLSLKCKTTTVTLREGYERGKVVDPHPLVHHREKFYHVMRTGLLYRGKGTNLKPEEDLLTSNAIAVDESRNEESEEEEVETSDEWNEDEISDPDETSN